MAGMSTFFFPISVVVYPQSVNIDKWKLDSPISETSVMLIINVCYCFCWHIALIIMATIKPHNT